MQDAQIIHLMLPVIQISCPVVMDAVIVIIQTEPVFLIAVLCLSHRVPVPVPMPCQGAFIQNAADGDHLAVNTAVWHGTAAVLGDQRRNQNWQLWI